MQRGIENKEDAQGVFHLPLDIASASQAAEMSRFESRSLLTEVWRAAVVHEDSKESSLVAMCRLAEANEHDIPLGAGCSEAARWSMAGHWH